MSILSYDTINQKTLNVCIPQFSLQDCAYKDKLLVYNYIIIGLYGLSTLIAFFCFGKKVKEYYSWKKNIVIMALSLVSCCSVLTHRLLLTNNINPIACSFFETLGYNCVGIAVVFVIVFWMSLRADLNYDFNEAYYYIFGTLYGLCHFTVTIIFGLLSAAYPKFKYIFWTIYWILWAVLTIVLFVLMIKYGLLLYKKINKLGSTEADKFTSYIVKVVVIVGSLVFCAMIVCILYAIFNVAIDSNYIRWQLVHGFLDFGILIVNMFLLIYLAFVM